MKSKSVAAGAENLDREVAQSEETRPQPLLSPSPEEIQRRAYEMAHMDTIWMTGCRQRASRWRNTRRVSASFLRLSRLSVTHRTIRGWYNLGTTEGQISGEREPVSDAVSDRSSESWFSLPSCASNSPPVSGNMAAEVARKRIARCLNRFEGTAQQFDQVGKTASHFCFFHLRELLDGEAYAT
jgi:hypothetical protein